MLMVCPGLDVDTPVDLDTSVAVPGTDIAGGQKRCQLSYHYAGV